MTRTLLVTLARIVVSSLLRADCLKDISSGEVICGQGPCMTTVKGLVLCAPSRFGTIQNSVNGVVCGRGQCVETARGQLVCSSVDGGAVFVDIKGVRCYGQCEPASAGLCERSVAGR